MENQEVLNPIEEYRNVQEEINNGNVEMAQKFAQGEFRELREQAQSFVPTPIEVPDEDFVEPELPVEDIPSEQPVEGDKADDFDAEAHERAVYDAEVKKYEEQIEAAKQEALAKEQAAEEVRKQNELLLKELEEARKANDEDDFFSVNEPSTAVETAPEVVEANVGNANYQELKAELDQIKNQQQEKDSWNETVNSYSSFWNSEVGREFAPTGNKEESMGEFNSFYSDLMSNSNDRDAMRLMHDIRKYGVTEQSKATLDAIGVAVPNDFEGVYDSYEIAMYAEGLKFDPRLGKLVDHGRGKFTHLEDAYYTKNRETIRAKDIQRGFDATRNKLQQHSNAAVQVSHEKISPASTDMQNYRNERYRNELISRAVSSGYKGVSLNDIQDPAIRKEMQDMHAAIKQR